MGIKEDIIRNYNEKETIQSYMNTYSEIINTRKIIKSSVFRIVMNMLRNSKGKNILDIGSGDGRYSLRLAKRNNVTAIDISKPFIRYVKSRIIDLGLEKSLRVIHMDATKLDFKGENFDIVLCIDILHHLPDRECIKVFMGINRVLKDGGILITEFRNKKNPLIRYAYKKFMKGPYKNEKKGFFIKPRYYYEFENLMKGSKLRITKSKGAVIPFEKIAPSVVLECRKFGSSGISGHIS